LIYLARLLEMLSHLRLLLLLLNLFSSFLYYCTIMYHFLAIFSRDAVKNNTRFPTCLIFLWVEVLKCIPCTSFFSCIFASFWHFVQHINFWLDEITFIFCFHMYVKATAPPIYFPHTPLSRKKNIRKFNARARAG